MDSKRLAGKVAIVTGASKGIGAGIAKQLAAEGAAVVVNYASSQEGADQVVKEITGRGGKAIAVSAIASTATPPWPNRTTDPKVGSMLAPMINSIASGR